MLLDVGLDTVAFIESHYIEERGLSPEKTVNYLNENFINHGRLGSKCSKGGLYPPTEPKKSCSLDEPRLIVLDIGLSASTPTMTSGCVLECSLDGQIKRTLAENQSLPDGLAVDPRDGRLFWTNMGVPGMNDGSVISFDPKANAVETIVPAGTINTPKQLTLDTISNKIYFCDREGLSVYRCNFDGSQLEKIIHAGSPDDHVQAEDARNWCVGIAVSP